MDSWFCNDRNGSLPAQYHKYIHLQILFPDDGTISFLTYIFVDLCQLLPGNPGSRKVILCQITGFQKFLFIDHLLSHPILSGPCGPLPYDRQALCPYDRTDNFSHSLCEVPILPEICRFTIFTSSRNSREDMIVPPCPCVITCSTPSDVTTVT